MKYLVMECHNAYAVLMDEDSRFVNAANMHYEVGQVVTDPILMESDKPTPVMSKKFIIRTIAAAACIAIVSLAGMHFFIKAPEEPHTVIFVSAAADIKMELDGKGSVISITSDTEKGKEIIKKFKETHKVNEDRVDLASDILEFQIENGYISSGDTVEVLLPSDNSNNKTYKEEFKSEIVKHDLTPEIKEIKGEPPHEPPAPAGTAPAPEPGKPHTDAEAKHEESHETAAVKPPVSPELPKQPEPPAGEPKHDEPAAEQPPSAPADDKAPDAPVPPAGRGAEEPSKPAEPGEAVKPGTPHDDSHHPVPPLVGQAVPNHDNLEIPKPH